jgi:Ca2+-binding RTX toxin-like protein
LASLRSMPRYALLIVLAGLLLAGVIAAPATLACTGNCADHAEWPNIDGKLKKANNGRDARFTGGRRNDELLGHHGSDVLSGHGGSDVLWGDHDPNGQPESQNDLIYGGGGNDFIYGSHGRNVIHAGAGNDAISVHFGRGIVDCGPGRDIYHVAKSRKHAYRFRNCEKVDYRSEKQRGGGLRPLP